jgi:hypothetical protein
VECLEYVLLVIMVDSRTWRLFSIY